MNKELKILLGLIVAFLVAYNRHEDAKVCNWWMATNLTGEPAHGRAGPAAAGATVSGWPTTR